MTHASVVGAAVLSLAAGAAAAAETASDRAFVTRAIQANDSEIMLGKIAQAHGSSQGVKGFGTMLVADHTKAREDATAVAARIGATLPTSPMKEAIDERGKLEQLSGAAFDTEFARYMVKDHRHHIADFRTEARDGKDAAATLARNALPVLEKHLSTAQSLAK